MQQEILPPGFDTHVVVYERLSMTSYACHLAPWSVQEPMNAVVRRMYPPPRLHMTICQCFRFYSEW